MELVKDQLIDENLDHKLDALALRQQVRSAIPWWYSSYSKYDIGLHTAYGTLKINRDLGGWTATRDNWPLVHARSLPKPAIFVKQRTAMAAALVHLTDGFGNTVASKDGLWWDIRRPAASQVTARPPFKLDADTSVSDDHEWGFQQLKRLIERSGLAAYPADENLLVDLRRRSRQWSLALPMWSKLAHGYFQLHTPYGTLIVRRQIGWTVERNGSRLVWSSYSRTEKAIFDNLENAKTAALVHARDIGANVYLDGTRWGSDEQLAEQDKASPRTATQQGNHHGLDG
jgi:hypothetical protein